MGIVLSALLKLQSIERQVAQVRRRLKARQNSVNLQKKRIDQVRGDWTVLHDKAMERRKEADSLAVDLKASEEHVAKRRAALNTAKTNKEYSAILTEINTFKADNAKTEDHALKVMQEAEQAKADADAILVDIEAQEARLAEIERSNEAEIARLNDMLADLNAKRSDAAADVNEDALAAFERIVETYEGEAMAVIEVHGRKPPFQYVCGGCFMSLNAEHVNALRVRDELRTCDNCGRILYVEKTPDGAE